jgi:hypothetical protein
MKERFCIISYDNYSVFPFYYEELGNILWDLYHKERSVPPTKKGFAAA